MGEFRMPSLGADMEYGIVVEWRVAPGDVVRKGDIVAVVDTDKATIEVEVFEDGEIAELLVPTGREVAVGTALARIVAAGTAPAPDVVVEIAPPIEVHEAPKRERSKKKATRRPQLDAPLSPVLQQHPPSPVPLPRGGGGSSPLARRLAAERNIDLDSVRGTGPGGAVVARDLGPSIPSVPRPTPTPTPGTATTSSASGSKREAMRAAIASVMSRSKREIPHYYLATSVDFGAASTWLAQRNAARSVTERVLPAALLLRATALAARQVVNVNGTWDDGFHAADGVHLGVAVSLRGGGLVVPMIRDADLKPVDDLMAALSDLVQRARSGGLRSSEMTGSTLTVTNLGDQGADEVFGVIYPPQVAIVGFGRICDRPVAVDGLIGVRPVVRVTLAGDHRASDGHDGGRFLTAIDKLLQKPEEL